MNSDAQRATQRLIASAIVMLALPSHVRQETRPSTTATHSLDAKTRERLLIDERPRARERKTRIEEELRLEFERSIKVDGSTNAPEPVAIAVGAKLSSIRPVPTYVRELRAARKRK